MIMTMMVSIMSSTDTEATVGSKNCSTCARIWIGSVEMPGPVRNSDTDTSLIEVMKASMKAAITPERTLGRTMVKNVLTGCDPSETAASSIEKSNDASAAEITRIT